MELILSIHSSQCEPSFRLQNAHRALCASDIRRAERNSVGVAAVIATDSIHNFRSYGDYSDPLLLLWRYTNTSARSFASTVTHCAVMADHIHCLLSTTQHETPNELKLPEEVEGLIWSDAKPSEVCVYTSSHPSLCCVALVWNWISPASYLWASLRTNSSRKAESMSRFWSSRWSSEKPGSRSAQHLVVSIEMVSSR